jgi:hypothetical protein
VSNFVEPVPFRYQSLVFMYETVFVQEHQLIRLEAVQLTILVGIVCDVGGGLLVVSVDDTPGLE